MPHTYTPDDNHLVYMTGKDCDIFPWSLQGADWWIMDADSMNKMRLTYMNVTGNPQCVNAYRLAGSLSFMSSTTFLGGVMTSSFGLNGYTAKVSYENLISVPEVEPETGIQISPNPVSEILLINGSMKKGILSIYNAFGQKVYSEIICGKQEINVMHLNAGVYFVTVTAQDKIFSASFIKG